MTLTTDEIVEAVEVAAGWKGRDLDDNDWRDVYEQVSLDLQIPIEQVKAACRDHWNMLGVG